MSVVACLKRHKRFAFKKVLDVIILYLCFEQSNMVGKICNEAYLLFREACKTIRFNAKILARVEKVVHHEIVLFFKLSFREEGIDKISTLFEQFLHSNDSHDMKPDIRLLRDENRKVIVDKIIHIA